MSILIKAAKVKQLKISNYFFQGFPVEARRENIALRLKSFSLEKKKERHFTNIEIELKMIIRHFKNIRLKVIWGRLKDSRYSFSVSSKEKKKRKNENSKIWITF